MWTNPTTIDPDILSMSKSLNCSWVGAVSVKYESAYDINDCHNNSSLHATIYGGTQTIGYYFIKGFGTTQAIRHSVWEKNQTLLDVTPHLDNREYIIFAKSAIQNKEYSIPNCYFQSLAKYIGQETEVMYYVYQIVDPRNNQPFYVGKGKGRRAKTHLWKIPETRNAYKENKIADIRKSNLEPRIEYIAENIIDETLAYNIEAVLIKKYGRKGYDKNGILSNVCLDNRPPNQKGKTYEEIYGIEKALEQRKLRSRLQQERKGYGPKTHTEETKNKISKSITELHNNRDCSHNEGTKKKIGLANSKYTGKLNKKSYCYVLTSPTGVEHEVYGGEATEFCKQNNLSWSTLKMQIQKNWPIPKKGKTKGWKLEVKNEK